MSDLKIGFDYMLRGDAVARVEVDNCNNVKVVNYTSIRDDNPLLTCNIKGLMEFFNRRCAPIDLFNGQQNRTYNVYENAKNNRGVLVSDYYWIRFDGDSVDWKELNLKGCSYYEMMA
jgi:hypothetical protein